MKWTNHNKSFETNPQESTKGVWSKTETAFPGLNTLNKFEHSFSPFLMAPKLWVYRYISNSLTLRDISCPARRLQPLCCSGPELYQWLQQTLSFGEFLLPQRNCLVITWGQHVIISCNLVKYWDYPALGDLTPRVLWTTYWGWSYKHLLAWKLRPFQTRFSPLYRIPPHFGLR